MSEAANITKSVPFYRGTISTKPGDIVPLLPKTQEEWTDLEEEDEYMFEFEKKDKNEEEKARIDIRGKEMLHLLDHYRELTYIENKDVEITRIHGWYDHMLSGMCRLFGKEYQWRTVWDHEINGKQEIHAVVYPENPELNEYYIEEDKACDELGIPQMMKTQSFPRSDDPTMRYWTRGPNGFAYGEKSDEAIKLAKSRSKPFTTFYDDKNAWAWFQLY